MNQKQVRRGNILLDERIAHVYDILCKHQPMRQGTAGMYPHLKAEESYVWIQMEGDNDFAEALAEDLKSSDSLRIYDGWFSMSVRV